MIVQGSSGLNLNGNYFRFTADEINLSTFNGRNGFVINGIDTFDSSGVSVSSAGDVNGDGFDDIIIGARDADPNGQESAGVLYGGAGNDILSFGAIDRRIDGGSGIDTLRIDTSGINVDLTKLSNNKITQFEKIDLTGTGNNSLTLNRLDVLDLSDTTNRLLVNGNAGDAVTSIGQGWTSGGTTTLNGILYDRYTVGAATLLVDTDITQTIT